MVIPPLRIALRYQNFSETPKGPIMKRSSSFCDNILNGSPKFLHPIYGQRQKLSETPDTSKNSKRPPHYFFGTVRRKLRHFQWYPPMVYRNFCAGTTSSFDLDLFSLLVSVHKLSKWRIVKSVVQFFLFQNLRVTHTSCCRIISLL